MLLMFSVQHPNIVSPVLQQSLRYILRFCRQQQQLRAQAEQRAAVASMGADALKSSKHQGGVNTASSKADDCQTDADSSKSQSDGSEEESPDSSGKSLQASSGMTEGSVDSRLQDDSGSSLEKEKARGGNKLHNDISELGIEVEVAGNKKISVDPGGDQQLGAKLSIGSEGGPPGMAEDSEVAHSTSGESQGECLVSKMDISESEVVCVDVSEASESVEVWSTPAVGGEMELEQKSDSVDESDEASTKRHISSIVGSEGWSNKTKFLL